MKLRLRGTAEECDQTTRALSAVLDVVSVSDPYPDCGCSSLVDGYLEVRLDPERAEPAEE